MGAAGRALPRPQGNPPLRSGGGLDSVAAVSGAGVWAAGFAFQGSGFFRPPGDSVLLGVVAISAGNAWAVGETGNTTP